MFEVECPDCRHVFDVEDDEQTARCPVCTLELDLVEPGESTHMGDHAPVELQTDAGPPGEEEPFEEVPCPHCGGPLLVSASDESGLCAHCERPLVFRDHKALPFPEAPGKGDKPGVAEGTPVSHGTSLSGFFDPTLEVTPENAPLVECGPVASKEAVFPMQQSVQNEAAGGAKRSKSKKTPGKTAKKANRKSVGNAGRKKSVQGKQTKKSKKRSAGGKRSSARSGKTGKRAKSAAKKLRGGRK